MGSHSVGLYGLLLCSLIVLVNSELTPPYFNLATGRKIYATATCGEDVDGPELYCKLVGANTENDHIDYSVIQGQVCDVCDPNNPEKYHGAEYAIDGTELWWQSPPLSRGMKYNEVNLTIDFGQEFHVAYLFIRMGNSPRPGLWTLEKSSDYGETWSPWQHFSDTPNDCETYFGKDTYKPITKDDDVVCTTEYSKIVPLENGEIPVMLLNDRPSANNYFNSTVLQEWTRATNIRIRLLRTKNLLGHLMSVARQDPTVTRRYFYSIKDISIGGRCMCNGHADTCDVLDPKSPVRILACRCQHRTCGIQCNQCCPGFEQKKWRQNTNASPFFCEPCNCHGHSNECVYDEEIDRKGLSLDIHGLYDGGGVCKNCQHNTEGTNCNKCKPKYYRPYGKYWNETDVCQHCQCDQFYSTGNCEEETGRCECRMEFQPPNCDTCAYGYYGYPNCRECQCFLNGTEGYHCEAVDGECPCKINFAGHHCKQCAEGYFSFPECKACQCNRIGSISNDCDMETGQCKCLSNFGGDNCERCKHGYYSYPGCKYCDCDIEGTQSEICNKESGQCICREGFGGPRCDQCLPGFYNYPECQPCNCSTTGSTAITCDNSGKCNCLSNFAGKQCNLCSAGYYNYPECLPCNCDQHGSEGVTCNLDGQCSCLSNFDGKLCDSCKEGFYNFPVCEECNCDPAGVIDKFAGCGSVPVGELCKCKERVSGRICNDCKPLYWNLNISNPDGCEVCDCFVDGTIAGLDTCSSKTGQCTCKPHVQGRQCSDCRDGTFDLFGGSLFGCKDCGCDVGGSWGSDCDKNSGQCKCHPRITGRTCTQPLTTHYFPTLYQFQYEYEDGYTPAGAQVRYQYDDQIFPGFSGKGYAVFSDIQSEVINDVTIFKSSMYRMVIRYVNPSSDNITASILIQSDNPLELDQNAKVLLRPTTSPQFVTVSGAKGNKPSPIVLDPGRYTITMKNNKHVMLDFFVLLPAAYYEASILTQKIDNPCELGNMELCRHYKYASVSDFKPAFVPFVVKEGGNPVKASEYYSDPDHLTIINHVGEIPTISQTQNDLRYIVEIPHSGKYVFVIDYITEKNFADTYFVKVVVGSDKENFGSATLYPCLYSMSCRQPVIDDESREKSFYMSDTDLLPVSIYNDFDDFGGRVAIISITAIPQEQWSIDYIMPTPVCVIHDGKCSTPKFGSVPDSKKIEFESDHEDRVAFNKPPYAAFDEKVRLVHLDQQNSTIVIESKVLEPGRYVILLKYYQPYHPKYRVMYTLTTGKQLYEGKFDIKHCPASSGCRGAIQPTGDNLWFDIEDEFKFTITNNRPQGVWLDYLVFVPIAKYNDDLLVEETFDQTKEFIRNCGQDHFHISYNASDFCKKAVFSLTADYNGGALPCNCDYDGSTSFECDPFGGQCQCKPNVIGRKCTACRTGFYGFPDCKPCDCPVTAMCEARTGECICPPNVSGDKCDQCMPYTYGFHQIIGCEECNCNYLGVDGGNMQCDLHNGSCACRHNIEGRACDQCSNGYFGFPRCDLCSCSIPGTEFEVCDKTDGNCFCKKNVVGRSCEHCKDGTYNLQASNPEGCTTCFCFGKSSRCESAYLRVYNVSLLKNVSLSIVNFENNTVYLEPWDVPSDEIFVNETTLQSDFSLKDNDDSLVYFGVLDYLLSQNSHITSYGGELVYNLYYTTGLFGKAQLAPDVILIGKNDVLIHQSYEQPAHDIHFKNRVHMVESNFQRTNGKPVTRGDFMMVLRDLEAIYIRASYWEQTIISQLSDVYLTLADEDEENFNLYQMLPVEKCQCPPGYSGLSCEDCAPGFYRDHDGPYGGYCLPCDCNGHSESCDCATGICKNCQHSTTGDHCEMCVEGYYGNATFGSPHDCMICACPLPYDSNNFAFGCEISESGQKIHCDCKPGYTGARCESCAPGYYGQPEKLDDYCKPCNCSGNINADLPGSCDTITGECLLCLNNTSGPACNLCAPGFYGDAIKLKDCKSCDCVELGTMECDPFVGECKCHENVIGERCDQCKPDHYGFDSGLGCRSCDCGVASNSTQCDAYTGNCACKPGVTGRQCDRCGVDFWKYTYEGCTPCNCNRGYSRGFGCNPESGQCQCLPGVIGEKCDHCPHRWVLLKDEGCAECDSCHHALLDVTDALQSRIAPVMDDFKSVALAFFTSQKLFYYDDLAEKIRPEVEALDPKGVNLNPARATIEELESNAKTYGKSVNYTDFNALESLATSQLLLANVTAVFNQTKLDSAEAREALRTVENLAKSFDTAASTKIENALSEAERILEKISVVTIDLGPSSKLLEKTTELLGEIDGLIEPVKTQNRSLELLKHDIGVFSDRLEDIFEWNKDAYNRSFEVEKLNALNKESFDNSKFDTVADQEKEAEKNILDAAKFIEDSNTTLNSIDQNLQDLRDVFDGLKNVDNHIEEMFPVVDDSFRQAQSVVQLAELRANDLQNKANSLSDQYSNITANSEPAIKASTAYADIFNVVGSAKDFAREAKFAAGNATELSNGIEDRAGKADKDSGELLQDAKAALVKVQSELEPHLNRSSEAVSTISQINTKTEKKLDEINLILEQLPQSQMTIWDDSNVQATSALQVTKEALENLNPVANSTPKDLEKARNISKDIDAASKDISQIKSQIENVNSSIPALNELADDISKKQIETEALAQDLGNQIDDLKRQIETARQLANAITVGVKFEPSTILELKAPETLPLLATKSNISVFFNTESKYGFLVYLGNDNKSAAATGASSGPKNNDFMALEIINGYPVLTIDLGNGPERITNPKYVSDGNWYQVIVDRVGSNAKLIVREELEDKSVKEHVTEQGLEGSNNVFNVDRNSRLFVGGYPPASDFTIPEDIQTNSFIGQMEELRIGEDLVGLWNFVDAQDNKEGIKPRDKLISSEAPPTGYRFNGNGYVMLSAMPYNFRTRSSVQFSFKASKDTKDGLMFFYGRNQHFMTVELEDGAVFFRYKLGEYMVSQGTNDMYNDDQWHRVVAEREGRRGILKVDDKVIFQEQTPVDTESNLPQLKKMFFGGHPNKRTHPQIVKGNFDGCIDNVIISGINVDLGSNQNATGVRPGCPAKYSTTLSFAPHEYGFLRKANVTSNNNFNIKLRFKTIQKDGVIFYATNHNQSATISLTLDDGFLTLRSSSEELVSKRKFNDGELHSVTVLHDNIRLRLSVDDAYDYQSYIAPPVLNIQNGDIFFGGLPHNYKPTSGALSTLAYFTGCISDATLNDEVLNFGNSAEKVAGNINDCPSDILDYDVSKVDLYFPSYVSPDLGLIPISVQSTPKSTSTSTTTTTTTSTTTTTTTTTEPPVIIEDPITTTPPTTTTTTTTRRPVTIAEPTEPPVCMLPIDPVNDAEYAYDGYRFRGVREQRLEIDSLPVKMRKHYDISLRFRSALDSGLLFYAADKRHNDFTAVYLHEGKIYHQLSVSAVNASLSTFDTYDDYEWHTVEFLRQPHKVSLIVDGKEESYEMEERNAKLFTLNFPIYLGGIASQFDDELNKNTLLVKGTLFRGCIKEILFDKRELENPPTDIGVIPCSDQVENGLFFGKTPGFVKLFEHFSVGSEMSINFDFKPRTQDGLLFSVHGRNAWMILELFHDTLFFSVKTDEKNLIEANYTLSNNESFCDGKWRTVHAVKSKFVITLTVDSISSMPAIGTEGSTSTRTNRPLFMGGHPNLHKVPGFKTKSLYKGCMRNISVKSNPVRIKPEMIKGDVWPDICPLN